MIDTKESLSSKTYSKINGESFHPVIGLDNDEVYEKLVEFVKTLRSGGSTFYAVRAVDGASHRCSVCGFRFLNSIDVGEIPHWHCGKEGRRRPGRGRPIRDSIKNSVPWPDSSDSSKMCLECAIPYASQIADTFSKLTKPEQLRFLQSVRDTVKYMSCDNDWRSSVAGKFYTKVAEAIMTHVSTRGNRPVQCLTEIMTACNLITV